MHCAPKKGIRTTNFGLCGDYVIDTATPITASMIGTKPEWSTTGDKMLVDDAWKLTSLSPQLGVLMANNKQRAIKVETFVGKWTASTAKNNPTKLYVFGDNVAGWGRAGQAIIRGLPNAYGIPTKLEPYVYMSDLDLAENVRSIAMSIIYISRALQNIHKFDTLVFSSGEMGSGLARLPECAPKTSVFLQCAVGLLKRHLNDTQSLANDLEELCKQGKFGK